MSFIYAEKYGEDDSDRESIRILCDTKVTPGRFTSAHFSEVEADFVKKYGIVKSTICCPELCVSFAGNNPDSIKNDVILVCFSFVIGRSSTKELIRLVISLTGIGVLDSVN